MIDIIFLVNFKGNNPNESLGDFLTPTDVVSIATPPISSTEVEQQPEQVHEEAKPKNTRRTRTSQRQLDKELKEEAERIRKENQELLKKEKEAMRQQSLGQNQTISGPEMVPVEQELDTSNIESPTSSPKKVIATPTTASGR